MLFPRERRRRAVFVLPFAFLFPACPSAGAQTGRGASPPLTISLEQAVQLALANNQSLRAQRLNIGQARAGEITAALKPNPALSLLAEDFQIFAPKNLTAENLGDNQEFTSALTYTFERGGKRLKRLQVARDTTDVVSQTVTDAERQVRFQTAQAFIGVLLAKSNLELAEQDLKDYSSVVELNRQRWQSGDVSKGDYLKVALQKLQFEQDVASAKLALAQSKIGLRQLLGYQNVPETYDVSGALAHKNGVIVLDEIEKRALANRPDFLAAQSGVKLANDTVTLAYGNRARDLTGDAEYKRNGPINGVGFGISIDLPIHDRNQGEIARSQVAARQAQELVAAAQIAVLSDVANAYEVYRNSDEVATMYESGYLDQARESRDISQFAYQRGATSLLDLLDAERSYRAVQLAYRQALAGYMTSLEQINFAVGAQVIP
jgi:cobalt-zinc-cadmium efflux system outer membrane protein